jgi:Amt family ammonium transporter
MVGMLLSFCFKTVNPAVTDQGLIFGETTLFYQPICCFNTGICICIYSLLFVFIVNKITPLRVTEDKEELGLDISQHGVSLKIIKYLKSP